MTTNVEARSGWSGLLQRDAGLAIALTLVAMHLALSWPLYFNHALIPDELFFIGIVAPSAGGSVNLFAFDNLLGYGALYWVFHKAFHWFPDPQLAARVFYWVLLAVGDLLVLALALKWRRARVAVVMLFYVTLPMVWWQGKITGPETLSHVLTLGAIVAAALMGPRWRAIAAWVLFGLAVGVKLTALPLGAVVAAVLFMAEDRPRDLRALLRFAITAAWASALGFLIANPFMLWAPQKILSDYYAPKEGVGFARTLGEVLYGEDAFWEAAPKGSLVYFGGPLLLFGAVLVFAALDASRKIVLAAWVAAMLATIVLCLRTPTYFGWYFYTLIFLLPLLAALPPRTGEGIAALRKVSETTARFAVPAIAGLALYSALANLPAILDMTRGKMDHVRQLKREVPVSVHAAQILAARPIDVVVDFSEFNTTLITGPTAHPGPIVMRGAKELRKYEGFEWMWGFTMNYLTEDDGRPLVCARQLDGHRGVLMVVGQRIIENRDIWRDSLRGWAAKEIAGACPGWRVSGYEFRHGVHFIELENFTQMRFATLNAAPRFESAQGWGRGFAGGGVLVGPGDGNTNVVAQRVDVRAGAPLKVVARAKSVGADSAQGRIQVNFVDARDKALSTYIAPLPLTGAMQTFERYLVAPDGAAAVYLRVAPHGPTDTVRYEEMRLMGGE